MTDGVYIPEAKELERLKVADQIKHARIAMLERLIFSIEAWQGETPLQPLSLQDNFVKFCVDSLSP